MIQLQSFKKAVKSLRPYLGRARTRLRRDIYEFNSSPIYYREYAQAKIMRQMESGQPFVLSRLGTTETEIVLCFCKPKGFKLNDDKRRNINSLSGVFPTDNASLAAFSRIYHSALADVDLLAVRSAAIERVFWNNEKQVMKTLPRLPVLLDLASLDPHHFSCNWTQLLEGKRILIIHPFADTIAYQLNRLDKIHSNSHLKFKSCKFKILRSVQSLGYEGGDEFDCWVSALNFMKDSIRKTKFDVALIGAGAYGLPLAQECKKMGKSALHLGGSLQLLFGVKGRRWDNTGIYNDHWVCPHPSDTPKNYQDVEEGCYW